MKKKIASILIFFTVVSLSFSETLLPFVVNDKIIEIYNFSEEKNKTICKDNVGFKSKCKAKKHFEVYGKTNKEENEIFLFKIDIKGNGDQRTDEQSIKNYKIILVKICDENVKIKKVTCEHNDLYVYIEPENPAEDIPVKEESEIKAIEETYNFSTSIIHQDKKDFSKIQMIVSFENLQKENLYENLLRSTVSIFNQSNFAIEYKDKEKGIIKGKSSWTQMSFLGPNKYSFVFTFEVKDNRYRVTFIELYEADIFGKSLVDDEDEYKDMKKMFEEIILKINKEIINSTEDDW